jgi:mono/diheme cytochrome c family protein
MRTNKLLLPGLTASLFLLIACSDVRRDPGRTYMPDMAYSRALETYADHSHLGKAGIYYDATPVAGTVKFYDSTSSATKDNKGAVPYFPLAQDKAGDTVNYVASRQIANPLAALNEKEMAEAKRLYNVNCAICHGDKLDGNGPIYNGGNGPYPIAPKNLVADPVVSKMPAGQMMYSLTYGKNLMGSYASQLSTKQRWMVIHYVQSMQPGAKAAAADSTKKTN